MNLEFVPKEQLLHHCQYESKLDKITKRSLGVNWIGFDKFEILLYGIRDSESVMNQKEIVIKSILGGKVNCIKKLDFGYSTSIVHFYIETTAISNCSKYIAMVHYPFENNYEKNLHTSRFHIFSTETGELGSYRFLLPSMPPTYTFFKLMTSTVCGWICKSIINNGEENYLLQKFVFDEAKKTCHLEYLVEPPQQILFPSWMKLVVYEKSATFYEPYLNIVHHFDFISKTWIISYLQGLPSDHYVIGSKTGNTVIALCNSLSKKENVEDEAFYLLINDYWQKLPISLTTTKSSPFNEPKINFALCSSSILFMKIHPRDMYFININVMSLKNLAMREIFANMKNYSDDQIIETVDLPYILKRQYFGPS